jgi:sorting nexin-17
LPTFPPKKLLALNDVEVEERRLMLEKYLQLVSQVLLFLSLPLKKVS